MELHLSNVRVVGLSRFVVNELDFNNSALSIWLNLTTPTLKLSGDHVANGIVGGFIPFIGEGQFKYELHSL